MSNQYTIKLGGDGVTPETVPLEDVLDILGNFRDAIVSTAVDGGHNRRDVFLSLVDVREGTDSLLIGLSPEAESGTIRVATAIRERDFSGIPVRARNALTKIWGRAQKRKYTIEILNGHPLALITPDTAPPKSKYIRGKTAVFATIERIGGFKRPSVLVRLANGDKRTFRVASTTLAEELGAKLFRGVRLVGEARWAVGKWKLADFRVTGIGRYDTKTSDPVRGINRLSEIAGRRWDEIDPDEYVTNQRIDGE